MRCGSVWCSPAALCLFFAGLDSADQSCWLNSVACSSHGDGYCRGAGHDQPVHQARRLPHRQRLGLVRDIALFTPNPDPSVAPVPSLTPAARLLLNRSRCSSSLESRHRQVVLAAASLLIRLLCQLLLISMQVRPVVLGLLHLPHRARERRQGLPRPGTHPQSSFPPASHR